MYEVVDVGDNVDVDDSVNIDDIADINDGEDVAAGIDEDASIDKEYYIDEILGVGTDTSKRRRRKSNQDLPSFYTPPRNLDPSHFSAQPPTDLISTSAIEKSLKLHNNLRLHHHQRKRGKQILQR